jgi:hypothetical protein
MVATRGRRRRARYTGVVPAVVLRGPANSAPELIVGPFASAAEAEGWAVAHPREGGYSVAQELTDPNGIA